VNGTTFVVGEIAVALQSPWPRPNVQTLSGEFVSLARLDPDRDIDELYSASHENDQYKVLWTYLFQGPFPSKEAMYSWLQSIKDSSDPLFFTVTSRALDRKAGMYSIMNIVPEMGRAELGNIWYSPLVQKTKINTESTFLFLRCLFDELKYRRVEWKCDNLNEPSKAAALRMGFKYEGLFRQHMVVKGRNRDTAWFSIVDSEWSGLKANFEKYLAADGVSLTELNRKT
jgi:RimJ/RimL family protein N-acetyltransferase